MILEGAFDEGFDVVGLGGVGGDGARAPTELLDLSCDLPAIGQFAGGHHHVRAGLGQAEGEMSANASASPGHQGGLAGEIEERRSPHVDARTSSPGARVP